MTNREYILELQLLNEKMKHEEDLERIRKSHALKLEEMEKRLRLKVIELDLHNVKAMGQKMEIDMQNEVIATQVCLLVYRLLIGLADAMRFLLNAKCVECGMR